MFNPRDRGEREGPPPDLRREMLQNLREFFAEAKSEFKKISWPNQDEIKGSTTVVCVTIGFLMVMLGFYDSLISPCVSYILKIAK